MEGAETVAKRAADLLSCLVPGTCLPFQCCSFSTFKMGVWALLCRLCQLGTRR